MWEPDSGYNNLRQHVLVCTTASGESYSGNLYFHKPGETPAIVKPEKNLSGARHKNRDPKVIGIQSNGKGRVVVHYQLFTGAASVTIELYTVRGRRAVSIEQQQQPPGIHHIFFWKPENSLSNGAYLLRIRTEDASAAGQLIGILISGAANNLSLRARWSS
jgi:hypothetical protein